MPLSSSEFVVERGHFETRLQFNDCEMSGSYGWLRRETIRLWRSIINNICDEVSVSFPRSYCWLLVIRLKWATLRLLKRKRSRVGSRRLTKCTLWQVIRITQVSFQMLQLLLLSFLHRPVFLRWRLFRRRLLRFLRASIPIRLIAADTAPDTRAVGGLAGEGAAEAGAITGGISFRRNTLTETTSFTELATTVSTMSNRQTTRGQGHRYHRLFGRSVRTSSISNYWQSVECDNCTVVPSSEILRREFAIVLSLVILFASAFGCPLVAIYFCSSFQRSAHVHFPRGSSMPCSFIYFP